MRHLLNDLRYAVRRLAAAPGFTAAAVITIALGVGINTGIFSVPNGVALRELPAPDAEELVSIHQILDDATMRQRRRSGNINTFSTSEYRTYRDGTRTLSGIMAYSREYTATLGGDMPREVGGTLVTCNYFEVVRQPQSVGSGFAKDCDAEGPAPAVVLGHALWASAFGADPAIVGRNVFLNRQSFTVVGVAPESFRGVDLLPASFFAPISTQPLLAPADNIYRVEGSWLTLIGRKADAISLEQVRAELGVIAAQIDQQQPPRDTRLVVARARPNSSPEGQAEILALGAVVMTAFGLVLLIACANVANLVLARSTGRSREIAVRLSLGASRGRVVQQLLAESTLIAVLGGVSGVVLAIWSFQSLVAFALSSLPDVRDVRLAIDTSPDVRVLGFALVATLASGVLFGLAPALQASNPDLQTAMKSDVTGAGRRSGSRLQGALVGTQVAVCMVLIVAAGLLLRGLYTTQTVDPGFAYEDVAVASFDLTGAGYDTASAAVFQRQLLERVKSLPGVEAVAQVRSTPLSGGGGMMARLPNQDQPLLFRVNLASPSYFSLLGIPIVRGRTFTDAELTDASGTTLAARFAGSGVVIVSEATARRFWPDRDPIGQTLLFGGPDDAVEVRVVGVAGDAQIDRIGEIPSNYLYFPPGPSVQAGLRVLARSRIDFAATAAGIHAAVAELDHGLVVDVAPLEANLDLWRSLARLASTLASSLGALALLLATVGVYGVVAYAVGRRKREIGIRIALGASAGSVLALMLMRTLRPVVVGAIIGVAAAVGVSRVLSSVLFGVSPVDPMALLGAVVVVAGVAFAAAALPARRAARVDPTRTLHYE